MVVDFFFALFNRYPSETYRTRPALHDHTNMTIHGGEKRIFQLEKRVPKRIPVKLGTQNSVKITFWLNILRQKTQKQYQVPLFPKAMEILEKYKDHPHCS